MSKTRVKWLIWSIVFILIASFVSYEYYLATPDSGPLPITVSKETTYILGPVKKDGTVNYIAYLNDKYSKGVTKENNAAIPLIGILGSYSFLTKDNAQPICEMLGIPVPPAGKKYFIDSDEYAYTHLSDAEYDEYEERYDLDTAAINPWNAKQYPIIAQWLQANEDALNATLVAMQRTGYYIPIDSSDPNATMSFINTLNARACVDLGAALSARAMLKLDSDDVPGAWADLIAARHLARRIGSGYWLFEHWAAMDIETTACQASQKLGGSGKLTSDQSQAFLTDLQHLGSLPDILTTAYETERLELLDHIMLLARETRKHGFANAWVKTCLADSYDQWETLFRKRDLNWDQMLKTANSWLDSLQAASSKKTFKDRKDAWADCTRNFGECRVNHLNNRSFLKIVQNHFGDPTEYISNTLISSFIPDLGSVGELRDRAITQSNLAIIAMALADHRAEKNAYPDKLTDMVPGYLKEIPYDIFIDKPFGYTKTDKGYLLYSVAENMKYDGPKINEDDDIDDIVVEVK